MTEKKLSIALCTYNGEEFLEEQLASIAAQTRPPDELVVCDDRSQDQTTEIVDRFATRVGFKVRLEVADTRLGSQSNFEKATRLCTGELIFFCDQDDVWYPDKLLKLEQRLDSSPSAGFVFSNIDIGDHRLAPAGYTLWQFRRFTQRRQKRVLSGKARAWDFVLGQGIAPGMGMGFPSRFKDLILPFEGLGHDLWVGTLIAAVQEPVFVAESLAMWRQHKTQQTGAITRSTLAQRLAHTRSQGGSFYAGVVEGYRALVQRLIAKADLYPCSPHVLSSLERRIAHLQARLQMRAGANKVGLIAHETIRRNYWKYGYGLRTLGNDLLLSRADTDESA